MRKASYSICIIIILCLSMSMLVQAQGDSDQDGFPDNVDACPNQSAPNSSNGCPNNLIPANPATPTPEPNQPPDRDGDGSIDVLDNCPDEGGPSWNGGCPVIDASPTPTPQLPEQPTFSLPEIPTDDTCHLATNGNFRGNVRSGFTQRGEVVAQIDPLRTYMIHGQAIIHNDWQENRPPETWYRIDSGWILGEIVRIDGDDCPQISVLYELPYDDRGEPVEPDDLVLDLCGDRPTVIVMGQIGYADGIVVENVPDEILQYATTPDIIIDSDVYIGTECDEIIFGTYARNVIDGRGGDDVIVSLRGNGNFIVGGEGNDIIFDSQFGRDEIFGGAGNDRIFGRSDFSRLWGGDGDDFMEQVTYSAWMHGGRGNDTLIGGYRDDILIGSHGFDTLVTGSGGSDDLQGGTGFDTLIFHVSYGGQDIGSGGSDADRIEIRDGTFLPTSATDLGNIHGNDGNDAMFDYSTYSGDVRFNLFGDGGQDELRGFNLYGGMGEDFLYIRTEFVGVTARAFGQANDDRIFVQNDRHTWSDDHVLISGGSGDDTIYSGDTTAYIFGGDGDDYIEGGIFANYIEPGNGNDEVYGSPVSAYATVSRPGAILRANVIIDLGGTVTGSAGSHTQDTCYLLRHNATSFTSCENTFSHRYDSDLLLCTQQAAFEGVNPCDLSQGVIDWYSSLRGDFGRFYLSTVRN